MKTLKVLSGLALLWSLGFLCGTPRNPLKALVAYASGGGYSYSSYEYRPSYSSYSGPVEDAQPKPAPKPQYPSYTYERNITNETNPIQIDLVAREAFDEKVIVGYKNKWAPVYGVKHHEPVTTSVAVRLYGKGYLKLYGGQFERFTVEARGNPAEPDYYLSIESEGFLYALKRVVKTDKGFKVTLTAIGRCADEGMPVILEKCLAEFRLSQ